MTYDLGTPPFTYDCPLEHCERGTIGPYFYSHNLVAAIREHRAMQHANTLAAMYTPDKSDVRFAAASNVRAGYERPTY